MKRQGFRKSSVGLINPAFQSKEGNSFFRRKTEKNDALIPSVEKDNFFDPMVQRVPDDNEAELAVQNKEKEEAVSMKEDSKEEIKKQEASDKDELQAASEEEEPVQAKVDEEEGVQKAGEEEEGISAKAEAEEKVNASTEEEEPVQTKGEEEEPVQSKADEKEGVQKVVEEEETISTKVEAEEKVSASAEEEEPVQTRAEEEEPVQAASEEEEPLQATTEEDNLQAKEDSSAKGSMRQRQANEIENTLFQEKGKGSAMAPDIKEFMEKKFSSDFSKVRIHTDQKAQLMNKKIRAKAFAHGFDIFFNSGQYQPETKAGRHLLGHELTHTIQQKGITKKTVQPKLNDGNDFHPTSRFSTNEVLEDTYDNYATVKNGSGGQFVALLQDALIGLDYRLPKFGADGSFGEETTRAVKAFQEDVGLSVDGVVGRNTIKYLDRLDRKVDVVTPEFPATIDTTIDLNNVIAQAGAVPSTSLSIGVWGKVLPENIDVKLDLVDDGAMWHPIVIGVVGNYSVKTRLLPGVSEVTGPGGNTSEENFCHQIKDLSNLGLTYGDWFMEDAILTHERFHATKMRKALIDPAVMKPLEKAVKEMAFPKTALSINEILAEVMIRLDPRFEDAIFEAEDKWIDQFIVLVEKDHGTPHGSGPAFSAERKILSPMISKIRNHAKANRWSSCAHSSS